MAEFLVERALEDYEPINFDFFDEDLMVVSQDEKESFEKISWKLFFGARNQNCFGNFGR